MEMVLVSICIPAYNAAKYIIDTLESVKSQTYPNWELIVVEDASMDGTKEIVEQFAKQVNQSVSYIRNEKTKGPAGSRNIAASISRGEWIAFLDSDDVWLSNHLSKLLETSSTYKDCDLIHSGVKVFDSQTGNIIYTESINKNTIAELPISLFNRRLGFMPSQVMISRKLYKATGGFDETVRFGIEDLEYWFRCAKADFKFAFSIENTCLYRQNKTEALTSNSLGMALGCAQVYDLYSDWNAIPKKLRNKFASEAWFSVTRLARRKNKKLAREAISKSLKRRFTLKYILYWALLKLGV